MKRKLPFLSLFVFLTIYTNSYSMHIMEGFLPVKWAVSWFTICIPFWAIGIFRIKKLVGEKMEKKLTLALAGAFIFVLSAP